jgi:hypothetical protein
MYSALLDVVQTFVGSDPGLALPAPAQVERLESAPSPVLRGQIAASRVLRESEDAACSPESVKLNFTLA